MPSSKYLLLFLGIVVVTIATVSTGLSVAKSRRAAQSAEDYAAAKMCEATPPLAEFSVPYVSNAPELNTDAHSKTWAHAASTWIEKDCSRQFD
ncbi:MAG TPA: hypothetical protein VKP58_01040, partial [Candidatus Acidoferrum sp.]|nr:hypothetical protein [Candidatus Acidoferrum sp.]